jgi:hypothetical protein
MTKTGWLVIRIMCLSGASCLPTFICFSIDHNKHNGGVTTIENVKKKVFKISEERAPY